MQASSRESVGFGAPIPETAEIVGGKCSLCGAAGAYKDTGKKGGLWTTEERCPHFANA